MVNVYVKLFVDSTEAWELLGDAEVGRLVRAILEYRKSGTVVELSGNERFVFPTHRAQIDRDTKSYVKQCETNAENGKKGGRPRKANKTEVKRNNPIGFLETEKSQEEEKEEEKEEDKEEDKEKDEDEDTRARGGAFAYLFDKINPSPGNVVIDGLKPYVESLGDDVCIRAMDIALSEKSTGWAFIRAILQRYAKDGVKCLADAIDSDERRERERSGKDGTRGANHTAGNAGGNANTWHLPATDL